MKRSQIAVVAVAVVALLVVFVAFHARRDTKILFTWSDSANYAIPICSSTVTRNCISGFTLTDTTASVVVSTTIGPAATTYTYMPPGGIPLGYTHTFTLVTNAINPSGVAVSSVPAVVKVTRHFWSFRSGVTADIQ
jgi:hypothetical protein